MFQPGFETLRALGVHTRLVMAGSSQESSGSRWEQSKTGTPTTPSTTASTRTPAKDVTAKMKETAAEHKKRLERERLNPLLKLPNHYCKDCEQWTHEPDRDSPESEVTFVMWARFEHKASGDKVYSGSSCLRCFDTRREFLYARRPTN